MESYHKTFDYVNVNVQYGKTPVRIWWGNSDEEWITHKIIKRKNGK